MLDAPRYLLGCLELGLLIGFAGLGAAAIRARLLPSFTGPPAWLATLVLALALLLWAAELLGTLGVFQPLPLLLCTAAVGVGLFAYLRGWRGAGEGNLGAMVPSPAPPQSRGERY